MGKSFSPSQIRSRDEESLHKRYMRMRANRIFKSFKFIFVENIFFMFLNYFNMLI